MKSAADTIRRLRRNHAGWLAVQLLLGLGLARPAQVVVVVAAVGLVVLAILEPTARVIAAVFALVVVVVSAAPIGWPLPALIAGVGLLAWFQLVAQPRRGWSADAAPEPSLRRRVGLGLGVGVASATVVAPVVFRFVDSAPLAFPVQQPPALLICGVIIAVAALNAFAEESLWRGAILATDQRFGVSARSTVVAQAVGFGIAHWHGIPGGPIGVLAAAVFGATMAWLRLRAGLGATLVAHFLADVAIFSIVAATAVFVPT